MRGSAGHAELGESVAAGTTPSANRPGCRGCGAEETNGGDTGRASGPRSGGTPPRPDGPIPGPYSMLSLALVYAGRFDGETLDAPAAFQQTLYLELKPIAEEYDPEALRINGLDRARLTIEGLAAEEAMTQAADWVRKLTGNDRPVLVAYPLSFDWTWLYWYFTRFSRTGSPFNHSSCFDIKTAYAVKAGIPVAEAGRSQLIEQLQSARPHRHHALDDAIEQAEIFVKLFRWQGNGRGSHTGGPDPGE